MGKIFRDLQAEAEESAARSAFEAWMQKRGTPMYLEQTQAYEAFKAGMVHQACIVAVQQWQAESGNAHNVPMSRARDTTAEARHAVAPRLDGRVKPL